MNLRAGQLQDLARQLPWTRPSSERVLRIKSAIVAAPRPGRRVRWPFSVGAVGLALAAASFVVFVRPLPRQAIVVEPSTERPILAEPITIAHVATVLAVPEPARAELAAPGGSPDPGPVEGQDESSVAASQSIVRPMAQTEPRPVVLEPREIDREQRAAPEPAARLDPPAREPRLEWQKDRRDQRLDRREQRLERHQKRVDRHAR